jgi:hypothetical protein
MRYCHLPNSAFCPGTALQCSCVTLAGYRPTRLSLQSSFRAQSAYSCQSVLSAFVSVQTADIFGRKSKIATSLTMLSVHVRPYSVLVSLWLVIDPRDRVYNQDLEPSLPIAVKVFLVCLSLSKPPMFLVENKRLPPP